jgi:superfamily I DNA and/or RNA helicase
VISPYAAQVAAIRRQLSKSVAVQRLLAASAAAAGALEADSVEVATIDSFQGREADAVVLSLVRSNSRQSVGFLADARRLNVAVTRARRHLAIVCDPSTVRSDPLLDSLLAHCEERGLVRPVSGGDEARGVVQPVSGSPKPFEQPQS